MTSPCPGYRITTGYKKPGRLWAAGYHTGVDHAAPVGTRVVAIKAGRVIHVGWGGWGNSYGAHVIIQHGSYQTMCAHLSRTTVREGQYVAEGQQIGNVGLTGNTTGPHVHVETRVSPFRYNNRIVNPQLFYGTSPIAAAPATSSSTSTPTYLSKLHSGQRDSDSVKNLQRALNRHPLRGGQALPITGNYLAETDEEVRLCQAQHGYGPKAGQGDPPLRSYVGPKQARHLGLTDLRD